LKRAALMLDPSPQNHSPGPQVKRGNPDSRSCQALARGPKPQTQSDRERRREFVHLLPAPPDQHFHLTESTMRLQVPHAVPRLRQPVAHVMDEIAQVLRNVALEFLSRANDNFRGG
jgi:hypothetical protein